MRSCNPGTECLVEAAPRIAGKVLKRLNPGRLAAMLEQQRLALAVGSSSTGFGGGLPGGF